MRRSSAGQDSDSRGSLAGLLSYTYIVFTGGIRKLYYGAPASPTQTFVGLGDEVSGGERRSGCQRARERRCDDAQRARADAPGCAGRAAVGPTCTPPFYTAGSYCAILPDSFAITHNFFHPPPLRPQVLFRVCLGLLNTVLSQFSLVSLTCLL